MWGFPEVWEVKGAWQLKGGHFLLFYLFMKNFFILVQDLAHTSFQYLSQCPGCQINNSVSYGGIVLKPKVLKSST